MLVGAKGRRAQDNWELRMMYVQERWSAKCDTWVKGSAIVQNTLLRLCQTAYTAFLWHVSNKHFLLQY